MNTFHFKSLVSLYILSRIIDGFFVQRPHVIILEIFLRLDNQVIHGGWSKSCWTIGIISDLQHKKWELMSKQSIRRGVDPGRKRSNMLWFATRPFLVLFLHSRPECPFFFFCSHFSPATPRQRSQSQKTMTRHGQQWGNCTESEDSTAAMGMVRTQWGLIKMENGNWRGWNHASWLWSWQVPLWNTRHGMALRRTSHRCWARGWLPSEPPSPQLEIQCQGCQLEHPLLLLLGWRSQLQPWILHRIKLTA